MDAAGGLAELSRDGATVDGRRIRVLLLADTHLGFDYPIRPRVERRRRGEDFFANTRAALLPAIRGEVDLVVHAGDLFFRSRVPPKIVALGFELLLEVARAGKAPVFLLAGNHERGAIPRSLLLSHRNLFLFESPTTFRHRVGETTLALSGFPYARDVRREFPTLLERTGWRREPADVRLLCLHQAIEGATVGPSGYTFRDGEDVVRTADLPAEFDAVLVGHIHRAQVLEGGRDGRRDAPPVFYPGSIERTSFAERDEPKGFFVLEIDPAAPAGRRVVGREHRELPARPMVDLALEADAIPAGGAEEALRRRFSAIDPDAIVRLRLDGRGAPELARRLTPPLLRALAGPTRTVQIDWRGMGMATREGDEVDPGDAM